MAMLESIVALVLIPMLLLIFFLILLACKPWRFLSRSSRFRAVKVGDLEKPLVAEASEQAQVESNDFVRNDLVDNSYTLSEGYLSSPRAHTLAHEQKLPSEGSHPTQGGSLVIDVISEGILVGQTLKCPLTNHSLQDPKNGRNEDVIYNYEVGSETDIFQEHVHLEDQGSSLILEVISGPSCGIRCSVNSTSVSRLPLTLGRVPPSDLLIKDSEVSGKHAMINWNLNKLKWELIDMGSLNGTLLNSHAIHHPDSGSRHWGTPVELTNGDIITLGTTSKIYVQTTRAEHSTPFRVAMASDPMALRRGGKKLPMEDVCYYQWPLPGVDQFGLFGICDGHGGPGAAKSASKVLPMKVATILSEPSKKEKVLSLCDASEVLRDAFLQTEACMNHQYEGCTATALLIWADDHENFFLQCANVGDSTCIMNIDGKQIKMTEDHRITSFSERNRMKRSGEPLRDGETRICGLNLARMLGDKFLKEQDARFSSEPYVSPVVHINKTSNAFALLASDGFWDVVSLKKAIQLVVQARERYAAYGENTAEKIANFLLSEARTLRTKDNTSIIFLEFGTSRMPCKYDL